MDITRPQAQQSQPYDCDQCLTSELADLASKNDWDSDGCLQTKAQCYWKKTVCAVFVWGHVISATLNIVWLHKHQCCTAHAFDMIHSYRKMWAGNTLQIKVFHQTTILPFLFNSVRQPVNKIFANLLWFLNLNWVSSIFGSDASLTLTVFTHIWGHLRTNCSEWTEFSN